MDRDELAETIRHALSHEAGPTERIFMENLADRVLEKVISLGYTRDETRKEPTDEHPDSHDQS